MTFTTNRPDEVPRIEATLRALARGWPGPGTWWQRVLAPLGAKPTFPMPNAYKRGPSMRPLHVVWVDGDIVVRGKPQPGVTGLTEVPSGVVTLRVRPLPMNDALTHELVHWGLYFNTGNADPDHEAAYWGAQWSAAHNDLIKAVDNQTRGLRAKRPA